MAQSFERALLQPAPGIPTPSGPGPEPRPMWRLAGLLAVAHVVLVLAGISLQSAARLDEGVSGIQRAYVEGNPTRTLTGGYVELIGFVLLIPVLVFLARTVGHRTETGRWATGTALLAGIGYVALTFAPGMAAGAVAMHAAQHGVDLETVLVMNNLRVVAYIVSLLFLGTHAIGLGIAALDDRVFSRWIGWGGVVTGAALFVSVPLAAYNLHDLGTLVWMVWWIGLAVCLLRHRPTGK